MLDLLPYFGSVKRQESYDQEVGGHVSQRRILHRVILVPIIGPRYTFFLHVLFDLPQDLLIGRSVPA